MNDDEPPPHDRTHDRTTSFEILCQETLINYPPALTHAYTPPRLTLTRRPPNEKHKQEQKN